MSCYSNSVQSSPHAPPSTQSNSASNEDGGLRITWGPPANSILLRKRTSNIAGLASPSKHPASASAFLAPPSPSSAFLHHLRAITPSQQRENVLRFNKRRRRDVAKRENEGELGEELKRMLQEMEEQVVKRQQQAVMEVRKEESEDEDEDEYYDKSMEMVFSQIALQEEEEEARENKVGSQILPKELVEGTTVKQKSADAEMGKQMQTESGSWGGFKRRTVTPQPPPQEPKEVQVIASKLSCTPIPSAAPSQPQRETEKVKTLAKKPLATKSINVPSRTSAASTTNKIPPLSSSQTPPSLPSMPKSVSAGSISPPPKRLPALAQKAASESVLSYTHNSSTEKAGGGLFKPFKRPTIANKVQHEAEKCRQQAKKAVVVDEGIDEFVEGVDWSDEESF